MTTTTTHPTDSDFAGPAILKDREAENVFLGLSVSAETDDLLMEGGGRSVPDSVALADTFWRVVRTMGPIILADAIAISAAAFFAFSVVHFAIGESAPKQAMLAMLPLFVAYWISGLYSQIWVHPAIEVRRLTHVSTVVLLAAAAGGFMTSTLPLWCISGWPAVVLLAPLFRNVARRLCANSKWWGFPTLIIGVGTGADNIARTLLRDNNSGLRPALLSDPTGECRTSIVPVVNGAGTLASVLRVRNIRHAVVSLPELSASGLGKFLDRYSGLVPHILVLSDHSTLPTLWSTSRGCGRLSGIEVRNEMALATLQFVKRVIDLAIASLALIAGLPLLLFVAAAVKLSSHGPIFFGHSRIGRHGKRFKAWKFRTMKENSDIILREHLARNPEALVEWNRDHKLRNDPRVTKFGRIARKLSLDELPQLWNVMIGDMSLVGPRPIVDGEVWRYGDTFRLYTTVKPGITGMWQVSGRSDIGYEERVLLDQFYIRHWSPWLDIYILAKTVVALAHRGGAY